MKTAFESAKTVKDRPTVILAKTVKGRGVSFMENACEYHAKVPDDKAACCAMEEIERCLK